MLVAIVADVTVETRAILFLDVFVVVVGPVSIGALRRIVTVFISTKRGPIVMVSRRVVRPLAAVMFWGT